jgi:DHA2 family multidrug resistance protein
MHFVEDSEEIKREQANAPPFDYIGTIFIFLALGCLQIGVDRGEDYDWFGSMFIRVTLGISFLSFLFGCLYLLYTRNPAVDLRVLKDRNFAFGFVQIGIVGLTLYSSSVLIPQFTQQQLGYTSMLAGLVLAPGAVVLMFLIPVVGLAMNYLSPKLLIVLGGAALAASLFYSMDLVPDDSFDHLVILRATQTIGLAFLFVPISTVAYFTLPSSKQGDAAALFSMSRNIFGGIGISIATAIVTERAQVHQTYLVDHLLPSPGYDSLLARLEQAYQNHGVPAVATASQAIKQVYLMLQTQEAVLAYIDVFWYTGLLALVLIPTALLMNSGAGQHKASGK